MASVPGYVDAYTVNGATQNIGVNPLSASTISGLLPGLQPYSLRSGDGFIASLNAQGAAGGYIPIASGTTGSSASGSSVYTGAPGAGRSLGGEPMAVWLGFIGLLFLLKWFSERQGTLGDANPAYIRIGSYNVFAVGLIATIFIILFKLVFTRFQVPGFTEYAAAI